MNPPRTDHAHEPRPRVLWSIFTAPIVVVGAWLGARAWGGEVWAAIALVPVAASLLVLARAWVLLGQPD